MYTLAHDPQDWAMTQNNLGAALQALGARDDSPAGAEALLVKRLDEVVPALQRARQLAQRGKAVLINVWLDKTEFREGSLSM